MSQLHLSMRHLKLEDYPESFGKVLGEGLYTLTTSNYRWPHGVSYSRMRQVRFDLINNLSEARLRLHGVI